MIVFIFRKFHCTKEQYHCYVNCGTRYLSRENYVNCGGVAKKNCNVHQKAGVLFIFTIFLLISKYSFGRERCSRYESKNVDLE